MEAVGDPVLLSTAPPGRRQRRLAAGVLVALVLAMVATIAVADLPLSGTAGLLPVYATAVLINDLVTACLLFAMFRVDRARGVYLLAIGFLFAGLTAIPWAATFPGVAGFGLIEPGLQATASIAAVRRIGFPLLVLAFALDSAARAVGPPASVRGGRPVLLAVAGTMAVVVALTWFAVTHEAALPVFMTDARQPTALWNVVPVLAVAISVAAIVLLSRNLRSVLDLWMIVVLAVGLIEIALLAVFSGGTRFSLGWWAGRVYGLVGASVVLVVLLSETTALYARLVRSLAAERGAREGRLAMMESLSASIAHEVSQPLASMVTNADAGLRWLERPQPDHDEVAAALRRIVRDGHRAGTVVSSIRSMFRRDGQERVSFDLNAVLREAVDELRPRASLEGVAIELDLADGVLPVVGSAVQIRHVAGNLMCNALDAMAWITGRDRVMTLTSRREPEAGVAFRVSDTGSGLDPALRDAIYEPFFTTKAAGTGMGLLFCRTAVDAHGGRLWVEANRPHGTVFAVSLPAAAADARAAAPGLTAGASGAHSNREAAQ